MSDMFDLMRRQVLKQLGTGLTATYAMASLPVFAEAIHTPDTGLHAFDIEITVADGHFSAYIAQPKISGEQLALMPVVLLISEIFGVHEYIRDVARRLAQQGYAVIAPNLFHRQGDPSKLADIATIQKEIISKVNDADVMRDLDACVAWADAQGMNTKKLGITGFCWGGRITWLYSAHNKQITAAVAWYGRLTGNATNLTPLHPIDLTEQLHAPVLGLYGDKDTGIPLEHVQKMQDSLTQAGQRNPAAAHSKFIIYQGAPHAFHADYRASYQPEAAQQAWAALCGWFKDRLPSPLSHD